MNYPKISIVTPSFNQGEFIEETILSILNQNYPNLEYIIIDGGSSDETVDIIKKYEDSISYWISEPDKGQWDAILKGLKHCTGEIFNWINSDDFLVENSLNMIAKHYIRNFSVAGSIECFSKTKNFTRENKNLSYENLILNKSFYNQQGFWFNLENLKITLRKYEYHQFHYSFDRILTLEYLKDFPQIVYIQENYIAKFRIHDESKTYKDWYKFDQELFQYYQITKDLHILNLKIDPAEYDKLKQQYFIQYQVNLTTSKVQSAFLTMISLLILGFQHRSLLTNRYYLGAIKRCLITVK